MKQTKFKKGHFGLYGGQFVPETLMTALNELELAYQKIKEDRQFQAELNYWLASYVGRPTPLYEAKNLAAVYSPKVRLFLKREDLCHTGAHKINNTIGQALLAKKMGKTRLIAETGAGQHGVATATAAALFNFSCQIYMGEEDVQRQSLNVFRMRLLGAEVIPVKSGSRTLKDAMNEAIRDWVTNVANTFYVIGSVAGPHPYPTIVRDFQTVIGKETKEQLQQLVGKDPDIILACVGGGSNSIGIFYPFLNSNTKLIGVEAAGLGLNTGKHSAPLAKGSRGVLHGAMQYVLQDKYGQITPAHSISAGLDYPGVGPEHCYFKDEGLVEYVSVTDKEALEAFNQLAATEGILPALESAHALAYLKYVLPEAPAGSVVVVNLSGRGDKDIHIVAKEMSLRTAAAE